MKSDTDPALPETPAPPSAVSTSQIFRLFLRLGLTAFGGPAAHVAMLEDEVVEKRRWLSRQYFLDLLGVTQLIPGPNSTEMALLVGYERGRLPGLLAAGIGFIGPAALLTGILAWFYVRYGTLPQADPMVRGALPAAMAVILAALWRLGKKAIRGWRLAALAAAVALAMSRGVPELWALLGGGVLGMIWLRMAGGGGPVSPADEPPEEPEDESSSSEPSMSPSDSAPTAMGPWLGGAAAGVGGLAGAPTVGATTLGTITGPTLWQIALFFAKVGAVLYGSGYVLVAFLEADIVQHHGWLDESQLLTAIAVGQLTPGPVLTTATFLGYLLSGAEGALVATLAIFLPSFVFVILLHPWVRRLRKNSWSAAFLDAVNAAAVALMAVVTVRLGTSSVTDLPSLVVLSVSLVALLRFRINALWLVLGGLLAGLLFF